MQGTYLEESGSDQWTAGVKQRTLEDQRDILQQNSSTGFKSCIYKPTTLNRCKTGFRSRVQIPGGRS